MVLILILAFLFVIYYVKLTGNKDIAKQCCKTEQDKANVKNARKIYSTTKTSIGLIVLAVVALIVVLLLHFTDISYVVKDFISTDFVDKTEKKFNLFSYLIPLYIIACRQIMIEVKVSEFLYKFFNVEEPQLEENPLNSLKSLLYKKKPANNKNEPKQPEEIKQPEPVKEEPKIEEPPKEEPKPEITEEEIKSLEVELPREKTEEEKKEDN